MSHNVVSFLLEGNLYFFLSSNLCCLFHILFDSSIVEKLRANGIEVYLVSGGLDLLVNQVAASLNLPQENVYSNKILFAEDGKCKFVQLLLSSTVTR